MHNAPLLCVTVCVAVRMAVGLDTITVSDVPDGIGSTAEFNRELLLDEDAERFLIQPVLVNCAIQVKVEMPQELGHDQPGLSICKVLAQALHVGQVSSVSA